MSDLLLVLRLILFAVFAVAGLAKLADREGSRTAVAGFGIPATISGPVATVLPVAELAAALLLIPTATATAGAVLALVLLASFCAAITRSLLRGEAPDCHCFGQVHSEPAGPKTLIRNLVLAAAAAVVVVGGAGHSATHWVTGLVAGGATVAVLAAALIVSVAGGTAFALKLLRRNGELLLRIDELEEALSSSGLIAGDPEPPVATAGLPVGTPAPRFTLPTLAGDDAGLDELLADSDGADLLLVFSDPGCGPCSALMPQIATWQRERPGDLRVAIVSRGETEANAAHAAEHGLANVFIQADREVSESFAVAATPSAVIVAADGTVASAVHAGEDQIRALVSAGTDDVPRSDAALLPIHRSAPAPAPAPAPAATLGETAPDPLLRTLDGKLVRLSERLPEDGDAVVLFWNPDCGFCERMGPALQALDAERTGLVVISTGSPAANRALELGAPILLDDGFAAGDAFGAIGTPSAVRIDAERHIASITVAGADAVLALAQAEPAAV